MNDASSAGLSYGTAIIGGGISGLAAAYELATHFPRQPFQVFEASGRLGGIVETVREQGFILEGGPDSWVTEKPWARELAEELGLRDEIMPSNDRRRRTYLARDRDRELVPMPDGLRMMVPTRWEPILHSPLLSWQARLAYLREPKQAAALKANSLDARGQDADESVADFVLRHFGEEVAATLAGPLLSGVFGGDIAKLSVRSVMAPFVRMEQEHGSLIEALRLRNTHRGEPASVFTTLRTGLSTLIEAVIKKLPSSPIHLNTPVVHLAREGSGWRVSDAHQSRYFDSVLLATPAHATRALLSTMQGRAAAISGLLPVEASSALVVALAYKREKAAGMRIPQGFGFLVPSIRRRVQADDGGADLMACTFVDQKFEHRAPPGCILLRAFFGGSAAEQLSGASNNEIIQQTRRQLARLLGPIPEPDLHVVRHWSASLPQYFVGHTGRMRQVDRLLEELPGLHLIGNAYRGVGLPDLIRDARRAASTAVSPGVAR